MVYVRTASTAWQCAEFLAGKEPLAHAIRACTTYGLAFLAGQKTKRTLCLLPPRSVRAELLTDNQKMLDRIAMASSWCSFVGVAARELTAWGLKGTLRQHPLLALLSYTPEIVSGTALIANAVFATGHYFDCKEIIEKKAY